MAHTQGLPPLNGSVHVHNFTDRHTDSHGVTWRKCTGCPAEVTFIPDPGK